MSIPKVIHFCWFGRGEKPDIVKECMSSWKELLPDYEIKEWNEDNFDVNRYVYSKEAYAAKKYAFVADVARFHVLYNYGGIYMDTDVKLLKRPDAFLKHRMFAGYERSGLVNPGLVIGCEKGHEIARAMISFYSKHHFLLKNGRPDMTTVCTIMTKCLEKKGYIAGGKVCDESRICIYPTEYFDPLDFETGKMNMTENTHSVHYYSMSWKSKSDMFMYKVGLGIKRIVGKKLYGKIALLKHKVLG